MAPAPAAAMARIDSKSRVSGEAEGTMGLRKFKPMYVVVKATIGKLLSHLSAVENNPALEDP